MLVLTIAIRILAIEREKTYHGINVMLYIDLAGAKSLAPVINL